MRQLLWLAAPLVLVACATPDARTSIDHVRQREASIRGQDPTRGRLFVTFRQEGADGDRQVARLPVTYASASVTLSNSASLLVSSLNRTISLAAPATQSTAVFGKLRPGSGYALDVSLFDGAESVATGKRTAITLSSGINPVTVVMSETGAIAIATSETGNTVGSPATWIIARGDTVTFDTGFGPDELPRYQTSNPGRTLTMRVLLGDGQTDDLVSPPAADTLLATASAPFHSFTWDTGNPGSIFDPANLTTTGTQASRLKFQLVDDRGAIVGESIMSPVSVVEASSIDLALQ